MAWLQLHFEIEQAAVASLETALLEAGALSVTLSDAADNPILEPELNTTPLWASVRLAALFTDHPSAEPVVHAIQAALGEPLPAWRAERVDDQDWVRAWLIDYRPLHFGRLSIVPTGFETDAGTVAVHLDPGLAFGTGTHPTTALCLQWLSGQSIDGQSVIDYGCGSGILAIAALKLGAATAMGIDHDPQALVASRDNAHRNRIADDRLPLHTPDNAPPAAKADIVLANILAGPLVHLADTLCQLLKPGAVLVMSGLLEPQIAQVMHAYERRLQFEPPRVDQGWACLVARAIDSCTP
ncbi:MAG TPA: 50S ribosomal protein L11 methyltransferase [Pseudomonadales bacterium]